MVGVNIGGGVGRTVVWAGVGLDVSGQKRREEFAEKEQEREDIEE